MRCPKCNGTMAKREYSNNIIYYECPFCGEIAKYGYFTTSNAYPLEKDGITSDLIIKHDNSRFKPVMPTTLEINCDSVTLVNNGIFITFNDKGKNEIKRFDTITINGIKFKKVEEDNE